MVSCKQTLSHAMCIGRCQPAFTWAGWLPHIGRQGRLFSHYRQLAGMLKLLGRSNMLPQGQDVSALAAAEVLGGT